MYKRREKSYSTTQMQQTQLYLLEGMEFKEEGEEELEEKETFNQSDTETIPAISKLIYWAYPCMPLQGHLLSKL